MGGIAINYKGEAIINKGSGDQAIPGLHAAGEAVSNCHGANRLGANSILDVDLGFGKAIGINIGCIATPGDKQPELKHNICDASIDNLEKVKALKGSVFPHDLRLNMRTTMQNKCGVFREAKLLDEAQEEIQKWYAAFKDLKITDQKKNFNTDLIESLELQNMLRAAVQMPLVVIPELQEDLATADKKLDLTNVDFSDVKEIPLPFLYSCARNRTESRGAHFRDDFPKREDEMDYSKPTEGQTAKPIEKHWRKHSISNLDLATGKVTISYRPVIDKTLDDEVQTIPPVPRVY
ncbi:unnamed protein product [Pieris macdunnoughi]|uniref:Succinate dehydrogenase n=1 Tax=Pieris macdunnoughi TaxID=345717 RepID=A0A821W4K3_9NEOP|nr:unnamed protein product [Pieris macdunnoughi]